MGAAQCTSCCSLQSADRVRGNWDSQPAVMERQQYAVQHTSPLESVYYVDNSKKGLIHHKPKSTATFKGVHKSTNKDRAVKFFSGGAAQSDHWTSMIDSMKKFDHPHICRLLETFASDSKPAWILELPGGRDLLSELKSREGQLTETIVSVLCRQMVGAISHLHEAQVCHAELVPHDFLFTRHFARTLTLSEICLKLIDCGRLAALDSPDNGDDSQTVLDHTDRNHFALSSCRAPEQVEMDGRPSGNATVGCHTDIWALGAIVHFSLSGKWPGKVHTKHQHHVELEPDAVWQKFTTNSRSFVTGCLHFKPTERPTTATVQESRWMHDAMQALHKAVEQDLENNKDQLPSVGKVVDGFGAMTAKSDLERMAAVAVARQIPESSVPHLRKLFEDMDTSGDGRLQLQEVVNGLKHLGHHIDNIDKIRASLEKVDVDGSGYIEYSEFLASLVDLNQGNQGKQKNNAKSAFQVFDADGDGNISMNEVKELMGDQASVKFKGFDALDKNHDGKLDAKEFEELLKR